MAEISTDSTMRVMSDSIKASSANTAALVDLLDGIAPGDLESAREALTTTIAKLNASLAKVETKLATGRD